MYTAVLCSPHSLSLYRTIYMVINMEELHIKRDYCKTGVGIKFLVSKSHFSLYLRMYLVLMNVSP